MEFIPPKSGIDLFRIKQRRMFKAVRAYHKSSAAPAVSRRLKRWAQGWSTPVQFSFDETVKRREISITIFPTGKGKQKWVWVTGGVRTGVKVAKTARGMTIQSYGPFTRPGPRVGPGTGRTGPVIRAQTVAPTIIKAREFEKDVAKRYGPIYHARINQIIKRIF